LLRLLAEFFDDFHTSGPARLESPADAL